MEDRWVPADISGTMFYDVNNNGIWNSPEAGAPGLQVVLQPNSGTPVSATTDPNGHYGFLSLPAGPYTVTFSPPSGYAVNNPVGGSTNVALGTDNISIDAGLVPSGTGGGSGGGPAIVAVNDSAQTIESNPVTIPILANDYDPLGGSLFLLSIGDAPHGTVIADPSNPFSSVIYTPDGGYVGADGFSYTVFATGGRTASAQVSINVIPRLLHPMVDQASAEGNLVSVAVPLGSGASGQTLQFSASGLPDGLTIDPSAGIISGRPQYSDAQTNNGEYAVSISATTTSTQSDTINLHWSVSDTNRLSFIDDYLSKTNSKGEYTLIHSSPITAVDELHNILTFSLAGNTATIAGTEDANAPGHWTATLGGTLPDSTIDNLVTVSVSGGGATDTRSFWWRNNMSSLDIVAPVVDDTLTRVDDFQVVGKSIHVGYIITGDSALAGGSITFSVFSGPAQISGSSTISFAANPSGTVYVYTSATPTGTTDTADGIKISGVLNTSLEPPKELPKANFSGIFVWITSGSATLPVVNRVRAPSTPDAMKPDRIPPRVMTPVSIWRSGALPVGAQLGYQINGQSDTAGKLVAVGKNAQGQDTDIDVSNTIVIPDGAWQLVGGNLGVGFRLKGTLQTAEQKQNQLSNADQLVLKLSDANKKEKDVVLSAGFSVSAVPTKVTMKSIGPLEGTVEEGSTQTSFKTYWAYRYGFVFKSDSLDVTDLDQVSFRENVKKGDAGTGMLMSRESDFEFNSQYVKLGPILQAMIGPTDDIGLRKVIDPATSAADARTQAQTFWFNTFTQLAGNDANATGTVTTNQFFEFIDGRSGGDAKIANSGFKHTITMKRSGATAFTIDITKLPGDNNDVKAGDMSAKAQEKKTITLNKPN